MFCGLQKYHLPLSDKDVARVLDLQRHKRVWVYDLDDEDDEDGVILSANTDDLLIWFRPNYCTFGSILLIKVVMCSHFY